MIPNDKAFNGKSSFQHDGKTFFRFQTIEKKGKYYLKIKLVSTNSVYKQGIALGFSSNPVFSGNVLLNGVSLSPSKKHSVYVIGEELFNSRDLEIELLIKDGFISFCNASDISSDYKEGVARIAKITKKPLKEFDKEIFTSGFTATNLYGNAFWIEYISDKKYRFHCNDHNMDDDFDDLIFDVEVECFQNDIN